MFSAEFDFVLGSILAVLAIVFFIGKGRAILDLFEGKNAPKKKRSAEEERSYQRVMALFCAILAVNEFLLGTIGQAFPAYNIIAIAITILALILIAVYLKRNF